jgi:hypothetical protein
MYPWRNHLQGVMNVSEKVLEKTDTQKLKTKKKALK